MKTFFKILGWILLVVIIIELAVLLRSELSPVWEYLLGPVIIYG